jgi:hypothetical protein
MSLTVRDLRKAIGQIVFQSGGDVANVVFDDGQIAGSVIAVFKLRGVCVVDLHPNHTVKGIVDIFNFPPIGIEAGLKNPVVTKSCTN